MTFQILAHKPFFKVLQILAILLVAHPIVSRAKVGFQLFCQEQQFLVLNLRVLQSMILNVHLQPIFRLQLTVVLVVSILKKFLKFQMLALV